MINFLPKRKQTKMSSRFDDCSWCNAIFIAGILFVAGLLLTASGCASYDPGGAQKAAAGQAVYHYKKTGDSCEVIITSAREVPGIEAEVDKDCAVKVKAEALTGAEMQGRMFDTVNQALSKVPGL